MELNFLGNKYTTSNEPKEKPVVQLKHMSKAYRASRSNASRAVTAFTSYVPWGELLQLSRADGADASALNGISAQAGGLPLNLTPFEALKASRLRS